MKNAWFEDIKSDIVSRLEDLEGSEMYVCEIGFELTMSENNTGSWYCSRYKARKEIAEHFEEFGAVAEYMRDNFEDTTNPLLDSETFHVKSMISIYEQAFNAAVADRDDWNDEIDIDHDFVLDVAAALKDVYFDDLF